VQSATYSRLDGRAVLRGAAADRRWRPGRQCRRTSRHHSLHRHQHQLGAATADRLEAIPAQSTPFTSCRALTAPCAPLTSIPISTAPAERPPPRPLASLGTSCRCQRSLRPVTSTPALPRSLCLPPAQTRPPEGRSQRTSSGQRRRGRRCRRPPCAACARSATCSRS